MLDGVDNTYTICIAQCQTQWYETHYGSDAVHRHHDPRAYACSDTSFAKSLGQSLVASAANTRQHPQDEMEPTQKPYSHNPADDKALVWSVLETANTNHIITVS